jgi:hypothetical protein
MLLAFTTDTMGGHMAEAIVNGSLELPRADSGPAESSPDVQAFTSRHGLQIYLDAAIDLAARCFSLAAPVTICRIDDPESESQWIEISAHVLGDVTAVQNGHARFTEAWLKLAPLNKSPMVRLALSLV